MNVNSGGPHILLFERDQQLTTLLSGELTLTGYEVHTARTAVEVFDAIARFPIRLVMVDLAQAQAGRREFWVALDAQRRGRGVQVFTFRCANLGGYGPDDPDERVETVLTDLEVDGPAGTSRLVEAVRARVPGSTVMPPRPAPAPPIQETTYQNTRSAETSFPPPLRQVSPVYQPMQQASPVYQAPRQVSPVYQPMQQASPVYQAPPMPPVSPAQPSAPAPLQPSAPAYQQTPMSPSQPLQASLRAQLQQSQEVPVPPARPAEAPRAGHSTFTDKIRAVFYPSSQSFTSVPETSGSPYSSGGQTQQAAPYQSAEAQPRPRVGQRPAEAEQPLQNNQNNKEEVSYQSPVSAPAPASPQSYTNYAGFSPGTTSQPAREESGLDQLSRMLRESQPKPQNAVINGNIQSTVPVPVPPRSGPALEAQEIQEFRSPPGTMANGNGQNPPARPGLSIDPQEIQEFRSQILQAARQDEAQERSSTAQPRSLDISSMSTQLRASPIQDIPFEQEVANRKGPLSSVFPVTTDGGSRPSMSVLQSTQIMPQAQQPNQQVLTGSGTQPRPVASPETPVAATPQFSPLSPIHEASPQSVGADRHTSGPLSMDEEISLPEQVRARLQQTISRRPEVRTSDDMLLDIVKSLPPMSPAPQPPQPQPPVLNGRATRSLGSVLLEGHLVPQERLQVAQHVQRMLRGVDLNYQLGEILLMFKLLTPDQLLAASLVSYGMISTIQISALGRIRQELHAMGLEYDLESLLVLFRILSPEQLREVRASWSS